MIHKKVIKTDLRSSESCKLTNEGRCKQNNKNLAVVFCV